MRSRRKDFLGLSRETLGVNPRHWWDDRSRLIDWLEVYNKKQSPSDRKTESQLGRKIRLTHSLTKEDLATLLDWKFQRIPGRLRRNLARLADVRDERVRAVFSEAIETSDEVKRFRTLDQLPSVGPAMISVILTFYDPDEYGVFDIHVWRELFGPEPNGLFQGHKFLCQFLANVRKIARAHRMKVRDVEKALFQRNYDEPHRSD